MDENIAGFIRSTVFEGSMNVLRPNRYRFTRAAFIEKVQAVHGDRYEYATVDDFPSLSKKITIECKLHGLFDKIGQHLITGSGCPECANANRRKIAKAKASALFTAPEWCPDATVAVRSKNDGGTVVSFKCNKHGNIEVNPYQFKKINECPVCKRNNRLTANLKRRPLFRVYKDAVWRFTEKSWKHRNGFINHYGRIRGRYTFHLDHEISIKEGFDSNIPPFIIGHWTNLHITSAKENMSKGAASDKDVELLIATFDWALKHHGGMYEYARY